MNNLIYYDNPLLRKRAAPVKNITEEIKKLVYDMIAVMDSRRGVGLAAIQVGVLLRIFVIRPEVEKPGGEIVLGEPEVFINPKLSSPSQETEVMLEGCLSIPGLHEEVERPISIKINALNLKEQEFSEEATHFRARQIMHENDHLNGTLFIDRLTKEKRKAIETSLKLINDHYLSAEETPSEK